MILIADSGSSKTDWRLITPTNEIIQYKTKGLNPYQNSQLEISREIQTSLKPLIKDPVDLIHFYGSGCANLEKNNLVKSALFENFNIPSIYIYNDLLGAARALCNHEPGITCILGTGANSCFFDGEKIVVNLRSFGYVLGDEGSGAYFGKQLVGDFLKGNLPDELYQSFVKRFNTTTDDILDHVYKNPLPNRYLGQFTKFLYHHIRDPYVYEMIYKGFELFFNQYVKKYDNYENQKVHFVGSVGFYFGNILRQVANDHHITVKNIIEAPISGLTLYHQTNQA